MNQTWLDYVSEKRRKTLLSILQELSHLQQKDELNFIIIGALPLLINGYLHYRVYWDVDLLFKDTSTLGAFTVKPKSRGLRIVNYDETLIQNKNIASQHTAWSFNKTWVNVDYIVKDRKHFEFYCADKSALNLYQTSFRLNNKVYSITLYLANPWDIMIDKLLSPRTAQDIKLKVALSVDIRHILAIYTRDKDNEHFWHYLFEKTQKIGCQKLIKEYLIKVLIIAPELGYECIAIPPILRDQI